MTVLKLDVTEADCNSLDSKEPFLNRRPDTHECVWSSV